MSSLVSVTQHKQTHNQPVGTLTEFGWSLFTNEMMRLGEKAGSTRALIMMNMIPSDASGAGNLEVSLGRSRREKPCLCPPSMEPENALVLGTLFSLG